MKIAITIWGNRISPVFDSASTLMIVQVEDLNIVSRIFQEFNPKAIARILSILKEFQIDALICGAISDIEAKPIEQSGVKLISFVTGNTDKVLASLLKTPHRISDYLMPGAVSDINFKNPLWF
ncbi:MAG: NifB/NifX family molybdenum-iron cluster-binding protein [Pseudomonadota bacterium]